MPFVFTDMKKIPFRLIAILILTIVVFYRIHLSLYEYAVEDLFIWLFLIILAIPLFITTVYVESKLFIKHKKWWNFRATISCIILTALAFLYHNHIKNVFSKPSLVTAYLGNEYDAIRIDFKTDGTFIFENFDLSRSRFIHGKYSVNQNSFLLDRDVNHFVYTKRLDIVDIPKSYRKKAGTYLIEVDENNKIPENAAKIKVTYDGRSSMGK